MLCLGRNEYCRKIIVEEKMYLSFHECFMCVKMESLSKSLRATYVTLLTNLFVDYGDNRYSLIVIV